MQTSQNISADKAKGCIYGAFLGDAIGAVLEFAYNITEKMVEQALTLPGGGSIQVGPGQITDDSELALCLLHGLVEGGQTLNPHLICKYYGQWIKSPPFDIGNTCRIGLYKAGGAKSEWAYFVRKESPKAINSQSNGSTMRMSPMAVYASRMSEEELLRAVYEDTIHTHFNPLVIECNQCLAMACQTLIQGGTSQDAYQRVKTYLQEKGKTEVKAWFEEMEQDQMQVYNKKIGWCKIAFQRSFYHLSKETPIIEAYKDAIRNGGDTDTNAAIIGMVLGARDGFSALPQELIDKILKFRPKLHGGHKRPDFLIPGTCLEGLADKLIENIPDKLDLVEVKISK